MVILNTAEAVHLIALIEHSLDIQLYPLPSENEKRARQLLAKLELAVLGYTRK